MIKNLTPKFDQVKFTNDGQQPRKDRLVYDTRPHNNQTNNCEKDQFKTRF